MSECESTPRINLGQIADNKPQEFYDEIKEDSEPQVAEPQDQDRDSTQRMFTSKQLMKPTTSLMMGLLKQKSDNLQLPQTI